MKQKFITMNLAHRIVLVLLSLFVIGFEGVSAKTKTYTFASFTSSETVVLETGISDIKITLDKNASGYVPAWSSSTSEARLYAGGTLAVSSEKNAITKIVFAYVVNPGSSGTVVPVIDNVYGDVDAGTWTSSSRTWTGTANTVTLSTVKSTGNFGFKSITITYEPEPEGIFIEGTPNNVYYSGDVPSAKGLSVVATYDDMSTEDVTDMATWTFDPETLTAETKAVTATATYKGKTAFVTFDVIVMDAELTYDLVPVANNSSLYDSSSDIPVNGVTWRVTGNTQYLPWKIGGKSLTKVDRNVEGRTPVYGTIKKIVVQIGETSGGITLNSLTLSVANNAQYSNATTITKTNVKANSECTFDIEPTTDAYYRFTFNVTNSNSSNKYYVLSGIQFHGFLPRHTVGTAEYATFCLPYNAVVPDGLTAYTATLHGDAVKLTPKKEGLIAAGEGVVLRGTAGTYNFIATAQSVEPTPDNLMIGVVKDTPLTAADDAYMLTRHSDGSSMAFRHLATNYTLSANKAYLKLSKSSDARNLFNILWNDAATGIATSMLEGTMSHDAVYNVAGQRLSAPQKGVSVVNGKLVIK